MPALALAAVLALLSAAVVRLMIGRGVLDVPGHRSSHDRPTPKGGGVGIVAALLAGLALAVAFGWADGARLRAGGLGAAIALIAAVAWADDIRQFGFAPKLAAQLAASLLVVGSGWSLHRIGPVALGGAAAPLSVLAVLFVTNAVNFIDGLNGLASGSVGLVAAVFALAAWRAGEALPGVAALSLAAGVAGFLPFNYPRARIFMGDVGSQASGLVAGTLVLAGGTLAPNGWGVLLPALGLFAILADVAFTLVRRAANGDRVTDAHRAHLYQLAHRAGRRLGEITPVYWWFAALGSLLGWEAGRAGPVGVAAAVAAVAGGWVVWAARTIRLARAAPLGRW